MGVRKPFKIPGRDNYYIEIDKKRRSLGTSDKDLAIKLYKSLKKKYENGLISKINEPSNKLLFEFLNDYLSWAVKEQPATTYSTKKQAIEKLKSSAGNIPLNRLSQKHIDDVVAQGLGKKHSKETVNTFIRHIKAVFNKSVDWGYLSANPFKDCKQRKTDKRPPKAIPANTLAKFLQSITDDYLRFVIEAYLVTGRSRAELAKLRWEQIDFKERQYYITRDKTHLSKWYPLTDSFLEVLTKIGIQETGLVLYKGWHLSTYTHKIKDALRNAGLKDYTMHCLRHSYSRLFLQAGGSLKVLQDLLGHSHYRTTEIYSSFCKNHIRKEAERVNFSVLKD